MARILVVDDDTNNLSMLRRIMMREKYDLEFSENGSDTLKKVPVFDPDLVILDIIDAENGRL